MKWFKPLLTLVALAIVIYLFLPLLGEIRSAAALFRTANWGWLAAAVVVQVVSYGFLTWLNRLALQPFSGRISFWRMAALLTAMAFIEVAIPSAGASGVVLRARLLGKYGYSVEASTFTLALETVYLTTAMSSVALLGVITLVRSGDLTAIQTRMLAVIALGVIFLLWLSWKLLTDPHRSRWILQKLVSSWNRWLGKWRRLDFEQLAERLQHFQAGLAQLKGVPPWKFILAAYCRVALDVTTLWLCFLGFRFPVSAGTALTGYGMILVLSGLAALPGGLGLADASVPIVFARLGVPGSVALAAGLTYRLIAFWLLRFIGFISWQILEADHAVIENRPGV